MTTRVLATLAVVLLVAMAGCTGGLGADNSGSASAADVQVSSIGQTTVANGTAVEVSAMATNYGDASTNVTATVALLNGSSTIAERTVDLGELGPDESASFTLEFDVNPSRVDGRRITFN